MLRQIKLLTALRLKNAFGYNEAKFSRDPKQRRRLRGMLLLYALLGLWLCAYIGALCWGLCAMDAAASVPLCLATLVSLVILLFTMLRSGAVIFELGSYEHQVSLPIRPTAIVVSRFLTMYLYNALLALVVLLPGTLVCGILARPGFGFYPLMLLGALVLPLIPMTLGMLLGMAIYALAARMRRRSLAVLLLSLLFMVALIAGVGYMSLASSRLDEGQLLNFVSAALGSLGGLFPPAKWFADSVWAGDVGRYLLLTLGALALLTLTEALIGRRLRGICSRLGAHAAAANFKMGAQTRRSVFRALYAREMKRYFASPIYVMNTCVGGLMALLMGVGLLLGGKQLAALGDALPMEMIVRLLPFALAFFYCISPSTTSSISLEGRVWWQLKCLPVKRRALLGAKLMVNLTLMLPCWAISSILMILALRPGGAQLASLTLLSLAYICFSTAAGLWVNLRMPMLKWESETVPVKQGRAVLVTMLIGFAVVLVPGALCVLLPAAGFIQPVMLLVLAALTALFLRGAFAVRLEGIY